jgi:ATP-binding cassette subfamily B protein
VKLDAGALARLRLETAWVDPSVQIWNRSLLDNLRYGHGGPTSSYAPVLEAADLHDLLESLPDGLRTSLGEGGALVSGGEGQRVRLGRTLLRHDVRLAVLDEPFRGLDRERRRVLTARARDWWRSATMLFVTHDVMETRAFDRVVVVDGGTIVEDGSPEELLARPEGRYRAMVHAEQRVHEHLWRSDVWRRVKVVHGRIAEAPRAVEGTRRAGDGA